MNKNQPTFVIFGCTGTVGSAVMQQLSTQDCIVRGVLRNPNRQYPVKASNISYVSVDMKSTIQLRRACIGADALFLLTATAPDQVETEVRIINAAKEAGISRIVKLSAPVVTFPAHVEVSNWHRQIEDHLHKSAIDYCSLQPYAFMQNWERNTFTICRLGKIYGSLGDAARNYIDCRDVAAVAVHYLLSDKSLKAKNISLAGPEAITNNDMANRLSYITGNTIEYVNITAEELFLKLTKRAKLPEWLANHIVELDDLAIKTPEPVVNTVEDILNRKPRIMDAYLQESRHLFSRKAIWNFWS